MSVLRRTGRSGEAGSTSAAQVTESPAGPEPDLDAGTTDPDLATDRASDPDPAVDAERGTGSPPDDDGPAPQASAGQGSARRRRLPGGPRTWLAVAAAVVLAALVLAVVFLLRTPSDAQLRDSALLAARTYSTSLTTFDARTFDEDVERVRRSSTEEFVAKYDETVTALRETVEAEQTVSTGTVVGAGVEQIEGRTATVLVAVDQQLVGADGAPRTEANRLRMVLERRDGQWLISDVQRV